MKPKFEVDRLDREIIELPQRDARMSNTEIGQIVGPSHPAVTSRIRTLYPEITAIIRLRTMHEILEGHRATSQDCVFVKTSLAHMPKLEATINALAGPGSVTPPLVLASYPSRPLTAPQGTRQP